MYQWQIGGQSPAEMEAQFLEQEDAELADVGYFRELLYGIPVRRAELDSALAPHLSRAAATLDPVERAILWVGAYELLQRHDVPSRIVLDEAVELSRIFGADQSHKFVNGVLDKVARDCRAAEFRAQAGDTVDSLDPGS